MRPPERQVATFAQAQQMISALEGAREVWQAAGLPVVRLHDCRHTFASFCIDSGMNPKSVCTIMGDSSIVVTLDLYGHLLPGTEDEALERLDAYFGPAIAQTARAAS